MRFRQREILIIPSCDGWLSYSNRSDCSFLHGANTGGQKTRLGEQKWLYPWGCSQVLEASAQKEYILLLILLHELFAVPTCWDTFHSCASFDLSSFFPAISIFSLTCVRNTKAKLRKSKPCWCLPYVDLPWDIFFLISLIYSTSQSPYGYCFFVYSSGILSSAFQRFATETTLSGTSLCAWFI